MSQGEHLWMRHVGNGPWNHPLLRDLDLPPLGDQIDGESVLVTKTLLFVTTYRRDRRTGNGPMVPSWDPWGDPDALGKLVYVFETSRRAIYCARSIWMGRRWRHR